MFWKDKSVSMSLPESKTVHGVEIKKVPVGKYIQVLKKAETIPEILMEGCFPGKNLDELLSALTTADRTELVGVVGRLLATAPELFVDVAAQILDLDREAVMNEFTPKQLLDIWTAFWELNELSDFFGDVWGRIKTKLPTLLNTGFKNGSPSPKA